LAASASAGGTARQARSEPSSGTTIRVITASRSRSPDKTGGPGAGSVSTYGPAVAPPVAGGSRSGLGEGPAIWEPVVALALTGTTGGRVGPGRPSNGIIKVRFSCILCWARHGLRPGGKEAPGSLTGRQRTGGRYLLCDDWRLSVSGQ